MLNKLNQTKQYLSTWKQWKSSPKKNKPLIKVANLQSFFHALNNSNIRYVVLHSFENILAESVAENYSGPVVLLIDKEDLKEFYKISCYHLGNITIDLYSSTSIMNTGYKGFPFYPAHLANKILNDRVLYLNSFFIPADKVLFYSRAYHICYHQGCDSQIPITLSASEANNSKQNSNLTELSQLAEKIGVNRQSVQSLTSLHQLLTEANWKIPFDLIRRLSIQNSWHDHLYEYETKKLTQHSAKERARIKLNKKTIKAV